MKLLDIRREYEIRKGIWNVRREFELSTRCMLFNESNFSALTHVQVVKQNPYLLTFKLSNANHYVISVFSIPWVRDGYPECVVAGLGESKDGGNCVRGCYARFILHVIRFTEILHRIQWIED